MKNDKVYYIYKEYLNGEKLNENCRYEFYAWTVNKKIANIFIEFHNNRKENYFILDSEDEDEFHTLTSQIDSDRMIISCRMKCKRYNNYVIMLTTLYELAYIEFEMLMRFINLCTFTNIYNRKSIKKLLINLKPYYLKYLMFIGFTPPELEEEFKIGQCHKYGYDNSYEFICEVNDQVFTADEYVYNGTFKSPYILNEQCRLILFSAENFIKCSISVNC